MEKVSGHKGVELSGTPVEIKSGEWALKVVPWIGGRVISMEHLPTGNPNLQKPMIFILVHLSYPICLHIKV